MNNSPLHPMYSFGEDDSHKLLRKRVILHYDNKETLITVLSVFIVTIAEARN